MGASVAVCPVNLSCREAEYSRATAELIKEAGQVRVESKRVKEQLEASERELERAKGEAKKKAASELSSVSSLNQELASRAQQVECGSPEAMSGECLQVLEMEKLLRSQQKDTSVRRSQLEQSLARSETDLRQGSQQLGTLRDQLRQSHKVRGRLAWPGGC